MSLRQQVITQSSAYRVSWYPLRRISRSNGVRSILLSKGETTPWTQKVTWRNRPSRRAWWRVRHTVRFRARRNRKWMTDC